MAKRITSVAIENYRAYYGTFMPIELSEGQNLLIYGENGSGKSSLFKGLSNYITSSNDLTLPFVKNSHSTTEPGSLSINFADFDPTTLEMLPGAPERYVFSDTLRNNNVTFIQAAALAKGFLDYTDLLKVYLHEEADPNLFELIVLSLLANHVPISSGGKEPFGPRWVHLQENLTTNSYNRNDWTHRKAIHDLPIFETNLRSTLDEVFNKLNTLLTSYFPELGLVLDYNLLPLTFHYGAKWEWYTESDLRLIVSKDGVRLHGDYSDVLNEARLSAIAVCLYLSSLLVNPVSIDLKILYLDDVFVGLDAGNRLPILKIIRNEFQGYQKFISTYDRHWFELAKRQFELNERTKWSTLEIYVGKTILNGNTITRPILVNGQSNYERAVQYLHDRIRPDYPAAANYFRKAIEEDISPLIPTYEKVDTDFVQIPDYQLTTLLKRLKNFLVRTGNSHKNIDNILGFLHTLLHPLSHHEISSPIYKNELEILEQSIADLRNELLLLEVSTNFKNVLEANKTLRMSFVNSTDPNHIFYYELSLKDCLIVKKNGISTPSLAESACHISKMSEYDSTGHIKSINISSKALKFHYSSLKELHEGSMKILKSKHSMVDPPNFIDNIEFHNGTSWQKLDTIIVW